MQMSLGGPEIDIGSTTATCVLLQPTFSHHSPPSMNPASGSPASGSPASASVTPSHFEQVPDALLAKIVETNAKGPART